MYVKRKTPLADLKRQVADSQPTANFADSIKRDKSGIKLIAEIKRASPSKGIIREDFDLEKIASIYEDCPVDAISVLTEEDFFQGRLEFISYVKGLTKKSLLRKDFIFDEYQIYESRVNKADAILLISAILKKSQAQEYLQIASELGLSVIFEVHDEEDLSIALDIKALIIGINNRNLKTMQIDLSNALRLKKYIPDDRIVVAESGINNRDDVLPLYKAGIDAILVGTSIMQSKDMRAKIDELKLI